MIRKHATLLIGLFLILLVAGACIVRTNRPPPARRGQPVYVEKHKHKKHKHKKHKHKGHRGHRGHRH